MDVMPFESLGRILIVFGLLIAALGLLLLLGGRIPFLGRLPGDIVIQRDNVTIYLPIVTSIVLSVLLTLLFFVINLFSSRQ
jgi:hypothetical protein